MTNRILSTVPANDICFYAGNPPEAILKLTKEGMFYKGELVKDAGEAYGAFMIWMTEANKLTPIPIPAPDAQPVIETAQVLTDDEVWRSDKIMAANAEIGLGMLDMIKLVHAIKAAIAAKQPATTRKAGTSFDIGQFYNLVRHAMIDVNSPDECLYRLKDIAEKLEALMSPPIEAQGVAS
jgi:hypothetical protein